MRRKLESESRNFTPLDGRRAPKGSAIDVHREYLVHRLGEQPELSERDC